MQSSFLTSVTAVAVSAALGVSTLAAAQTAPPMGWPGLSQAQPLGFLAGRRQTLVQLTNGRGRRGIFGDAGQAARLQRIGALSLGER
jgi:hypothetical protein